MPTPTPPFFEHLSIAPTADMRQIKRAYAVALRRIDQATEREAFEALRTAYGRALAWAEQMRHKRDDAAEPNENADADEHVDHRPTDDHADDVLEPGEHSRAHPPPTDAHAGEHGDSQAALPQTTEPQHLRTFTIPALRPAAPAAPIVLPSALKASAELDLAAEQAALAQWADRLLAAGGDAATMLQQALGDVRLSHLESRSRLAARLADGLYREPDGRAVLFDAAVAAFGWADRNARAGGGWAAADWVQQVIDEGLLWDAQPNSARRRQREALDAILATNIPTGAQVKAQVPVLRTLQTTFGAWLPLRVSSARQDVWTRLWAEPAMDTFDALPGEALPGAAGSRMSNTALLKKAGTTAGAVLLALTIVAYVLLSTIRGSAPEPSRSANAGSPAQAESPTLAFEFTGPIDRDSCETAHQFVHESNWLSIDDVDAIALLATRAMQCQDKTLWPQAVDPLMACLRTERAAALVAGRAENSVRCDRPAK